MDLKGKVAMVTGGAQGIGRAIGEILLKNGVKVGLLDINVPAGEATKAAFEQAYGAANVLFLPCDVTSESQLKDCFSKTLEKFKKLDIVCNNAGTFDEDNWEKCINVNLVSTIRGTYLGIEHMNKETGGAGGVIVNVASLAGLVPFDGGPVYTASKHGMVGFSKAISMSSFEKQGVRVNVVCPSFVDTVVLRNMKFNEKFSFLKEKLDENMARMGLMEPSEVAEGFLQLVLDQSRNGAVMMVLKDGKIEYQVQHAGLPAEAQKPM